MIRSALYSSLLAIALASVATPAMHADTIDNFNLTVGSDTISWSLPSPATPVEPGITGSGFAPAVYFNGQAVTFPEVVIQAPQGGPDLTLNFDLGTTAYSYQLNGPVLYTGSVNSPTFLIGTFGLTGTLYEFNNGVSPQAVSAELTIAPVPEPSSLALLLSGLTAGSLAVRSRFRRPSPKRS